MASGVLGLGWRRSAPGRDDASRSAALTQSEWPTPGAIGRPGPPALGPRAGRSASGLTGLVQFPARRSQHGLADAVERGGCRPGVPAWRAGSTWWWPSRSRADRARRSPTGPPVPGTRLRPASRPACLQLLDDLGGDGWQLVGIDEGVYRPIASGAVAASPGVGRAPPPRGAQVAGDIRALQQPLLRAAAVPSARPAAVCCGRGVVADCALPEVRRRQWSAPIAASTSMDGIRHHPLTPPDQDL